MSILLINPTPKAQADMIALLKQQVPAAYGIEITLPALLPYLAGNLDGQHNASGGSAAIELALDCEIPPDAIYAVSRPDIDASGAIVVLEMRRAAEEISAEMLDRISFVAKHDAFAFGEWPGVQPVKGLGNEENLQYGAINGICMDFKKPIMERFALIDGWVKTGELPGLTEAVERLRVEKQRCIADTAIVQQIGSMVVLRSPFFGATEVGYCYAPVVVVANDGFVFSGVEGKHLKYTICQYQAGRYADLPSAVKALNVLEQNGTWGGSPTIIGSPQGVSSSLTMEQVAAVVQQHLL